MGLFGFIKQKAIQHEGEALVKENPAMKAFLQKYKGPIGFVFLTAWGWSVYNECPHVLSFDLLSFIHVTCSTTQQVLGYIGFFLVGAGVIRSDQYHKDKAEAIKSGQILG